MVGGSGKPVIILGAGGHAKVLAESMIQSGHDILGYVTPDIEPGASFNGAKVLGPDEVIFDYPAQEISLANGLGAIPGNNLRWKLASELRERGYSFSSVTHPSSVISSDVYISNGVQVMARAVVQPGARVGQDSIINTGVLLDHDCTVGNKCHLAPGVTCSGDVSIGSRSHLGTGTIVIQGVSIGRNVVIAAGSVVYEDLPDNVILIQKRQPTITGNLKKNRA